MKTRSSSTLALGALLLLVLAACNPQADTTLDDEDDMTTSSAMMEDDGPYLDDSDSSEDEDDIEFDVSSTTTSSVPTTGGTSSVKEGAVRVIAVSVGDWYFKPDVINIKKGEKVQIQVTGDSGIHGFGIPSLGINVRVETGKTITIDIPTDTVGSFEIMCTVPCGAGHKEMKATVVITE